MQKHKENKLTKQKCLLVYHLKPKFISYIVPVILEMWFKVVRLKLKFHETARRRFEEQFNDILLAVHFCLQL